MVGRFVRQRYPLLVLVTILVVALALLLIRGDYRILILGGGPGLEQGTTGAGSGAAGLSGGSAIGEVGVPDALGATSGYQAIDRSQTTGGNMARPQLGGDTTGARATTVQAPGGQTTGGETANGQSTGGQISGSPTSGAQPTGGTTTETQPTGGQTAGGQTPGDQQMGGGTTGGLVTGGQASGGDIAWGDDGSNHASEGVATPELPSGLLVVIGLISLLGIGWLNARRRNALDRT